MSTRPTLPAAPASVAAGAGAAALVLPALYPHLSRTGTRLATGLLAAAAAAGTAWAVAHLRPGRWLAPLGALLAVTAAWLLAQIPLDGVAWLVGGLLGAGVGLARPRRDAGGRDRATVRTAAAGGIAFVVAVRLVAGRDPALAAGAALVVASAAATLAVRPAGAPSQLRGRSVAVGVAAALYGLAVAGWIGGNSVSAQWFGHLVDHGPRGERRVAITFDDGPNATTTLALAGILDGRGVKGTFFSVGRAVDARPDISRALVADGHLVGNHSYLHDQLRWLDPRYPELGRAERAIARRVGVCPALFRPPHGEHTPFMARVVHGSHMVMVTWDASAGDWATRDARLIARRILAKVRPGSIVDLHDGLDGDVTSDRTVLVRALPLILDGLRARGLQVVRLDVLLGVPAYRPSC